MNVFLTLFVHVFFSSLKKSSSVFVTLFSVKTFESSRSHSSNCFSSFDILISDIEREFWQICLIGEHYLIEVKYPLSSCLICLCFQKKSSLIWDV